MHFLFFFLLSTIVPAAPSSHWRWDGGAAKQTGSGGAPGSGGGGRTADICRGWRTQCTGNGVSRRVLVGHYPGILMKCGQFTKGGLWMACRMHGWAEAAHTLAPFESSPYFSVPGACIPSAPSRRTAPDGTQAASVAHAPLGRVQGH